jgi:Mrp family chromosome partitioning ATPase
VQTSRAVYESFLTRARETGEQERLDTKNIRIISLADLPQRRSWPPRNAFLLLGALFFGVGTGTGLAFLRDARRAAAPEIRAPAPTGELPLLAILPSRSAARELDVLARPQSPFATEIRALEQALRAGKAPRNVLIVATRDDDDAAAVALNLAAVAASRQRVLVIDADPRRRAISRLIPFAPSAGLAEVAAGSIALAAAVKCDDRSGISIVALSAKGREQEKSDLAGIDAALTAAKSFDLIIVAGSARSGHDVRLLANFADKIAIIVDAGGVNDGDADVFGLLDGKEDRIAGVVVANAASQAQPTAA